MEEDRRRFLRRAGLTALCLAGEGPLRQLASGAEASTGEVRKGPHWAMVVDLRRCAEKDGCTLCAEACHRAHNVPSIADPKHEVKWIWREPFRDAFPEQNAPVVDESLAAKPVHVLCNQCDNPPCVRVCPTEATWKRPDGIVMMDWHRCIGCRYCMAACPYGSRSFNWGDPRPHIAKVRNDYPTRTKGVVEKCTFCEERLSRREAPACVEACKDKALVFGDLDDPGSEVRRLLSSRFALRRKPALGTEPEVYYLV
jgi:molybdopterin-containing oxidoreductase family iron-sulfur binding subunit